MLNLFSDELRRNPFPMYDLLRSTSPVFRAPPPFDHYMIFDYEGVRRALSDHEIFSSAVPAPRNWFIFLDPPRHTKLRALNLEPRIRALSRDFLDKVRGRGEMDLATEYAVPLPMMVIATMIGIPTADWPRFRYWSDEILKLSYTMRGIGEQEVTSGLASFNTVTAEMDAYLAEMIAQRRAVPQDDLLTRLIHAEVDGEQLTQAEILGFFQLLVVGGQETTANLINNAILCFIENPQELARLRAAPQLLPSAIEEILRYRSPLVWTMRTPKKEVEMHGQVIPPGKLVLPMIGSANRDPKQFRDANCFDITRDPNLHIAFGHGTHACLGAPLSRLETRLALADLLERFEQFELASAEPWPPRQALGVHGPARLPIRFRERQVVYA
jgi:cytochrome P450